MQSVCHPKLHVGIIMDGNGRWATGRGLCRARGHEAGVAAIRPVVEAAADEGVGTMTLYAFSSDNWRRPEAEVSALMGLLRGYLAEEIDRLVSAGVRLTVIGRRDRLPPGLGRRIAAAEARTAGAGRLHLRIAFDYSSRDAILAAALKAPAGTTREDFAAMLAGPDAAGDVDLLVRTGGERRLSDFLLWECAYAELRFEEEMWPDFGPSHLKAALADFRRRERRFGGLSGDRVAA